MSNIKILVDSSGSMGEIGISSVVKYIIYILNNNFVINNISYRLISINDEMKEIKKLKELKFVGKLNENILKQYLIENKDDKIIFLSDGDFYIEKIEGITNNKNLYCINFSENVKVSLENLTNKNNIFHSSQISNLLKEVI
jgi:hypothetical protein